MKKECLFCDQNIIAQHVVCGKHMPWYRAWGQEKWFKELVRSQNKQRAIDMKECYPVDNVPNITTTNMRTIVKKVKPMQPLVDGKRKQGRPQAIDHNLVISLLNSGVKPTQIIKDYNINASTLYNIKHRKKSNLH